MTDYRSGSGEVVEGVMVYAHLRQNIWSVVRSDDGTLVVEDEDDEVMVLHRIPGTEQSAKGPHIYTPGEG